MKPIFYIQKICSVFGVVSVLYSSGPIDTDTVYINNVYKKEMDTKVIIKDSLYSLNGIYYFSIDSEKIVISDLNYVYFYDLEGNRQKKFGLNKYRSFYNCGDLVTLKNHSFVVSELIYGKLNLLLFDKSGVQIKKIKHDPSIVKIVVDRNGDILVGGLYINGYDEMLEKYDENTFSPSRRSKLGVKRFFENASGYWIIKYNSQLIPKDSILYDTGNMEEKLEASNYWMFSFDVDEDNSLWVYGYPDTTIRHYDENGKFLSEFALEPEDVQMPPEGLAVKQWRRLSRKSNGFYWGFSLSVIKNKIIITYKRQYPDIKGKSIILTVYTKSGKFLRSGPQKLDRCLV